MKNKIVIANFKMNPVSLKETQKIVRDIEKGISLIKKTEVVLCPPLVFFGSLKRKSKKIFYGAQNSFYEEKGAYTGEVSNNMLSDLGLKYVILGHSERRNGEIGVKEDDSLINKKVKSAFSFSLIPVLCIGEVERDESHQYLEYIKNQIEIGLNGISKNLIEKVIIAYEPVWAIGKNAVREATPEEFREIYVFIKKILSDKFGAKNIENLRIIYGGSVHPENCESFLRDGGADGFLVGRDSLNPKKFLQIINTVESL